ncbi:MAG: hypothetical protein JWM32_1202 [Verrucomicrobia bacterium]|nr:hypothetical protein [Verrucomicrobiota bacterium]
MTEYEQTLQLVVKFIGLGVSCGGFAFGAAWILRRFDDAGGGTLHGED